MRRNLYRRQSSVHEISRPTSKYFWKKMKKMYIRKQFLFVALVFSSLSTLLMVSYSLQPPRGSYETSDAVLTRKEQRNLLGKGEDLINKNGSDENEEKKMKQSGIVFLKVHKAASTTVQNIIMRFAMSKFLDLMLPKTSNILTETGYLIHEDNLHTYPIVKRYDVICNHIIFNQDYIPRFLKSPENTIYVGIVREPFAQFTSAFYYYLNNFQRDSLVKIASSKPDNPVRGFLEDPRRYAEAEDYAMTMSYMNNRMSVDYGFPMWDIENTKYDTKFVQQFIHEVHRTFDLIMVVEYFDESVVLLRRLMNWNMSDILYIPANRQEDQPLNVTWTINKNFTEEDRKLHKRYAPVDHALYSHFKQVLIDKINHQPDDFAAEVKKYKEILQTVTRFCKAIEDGEEPNSSRIRIKRNEWTSSFTFGHIDCIALTLPEKKIVEYARYLQTRKYKDGIKKPFLKVLVNELRRKTELPTPPQKPTLRT